MKFLDLIDELNKQVPFKLILAQRYVISWINKPIIRLLIVKLLRFFLQFLYSMYRPRIAGFAYSEPI